MYEIILRFACVVSICRTLEEEVRDKNGDTKKRGRTSNDPSYPRMSHLFIPNEPGGQLCFKSIMALSCGGEDTKSKEEFREVRRTRLDAAIGEFAPETPKFPAGNCAEVVHVIA